MFVNKTYSMLPEFDEKAVAVKTDRPFVYQYYNVKCYTANPHTKTSEVPARIINSVIKAMNDRNRLPRILVIIPDWDVVKYVNYFNFGFREIAEAIVEWMAASVTKSIDQ